MCSSSDHKIYVLIPAAGQGSRLGLGHNKIWTHMAGRSLLSWTLQALLTIPDLAGLVVLGQSQELEALEQESRSVLHHWANEDPQFIAPELWVLAGGETRQQTVALGLEALVETLSPAEQEAAWVLVHDAARCLIKPETLSCFVARLQEMDRGLLTLAVPAVDTIAIAPQGEIQQVPERRACYQIQTPQAYRLKEGLEWHRLASQEDKVYTDDASLALAAGGQAYVCPGDRENLKVTTPEDLSWARAILEKRRQAQTASDF